MPNLYFFIISGALIILIGAFTFYLFKIKKRLDLFFQGSQAKDFEGVLKELLKKIKKDEKDVKKIFEEISRLDGISQKSFQKIGVIRYNPFKDAGGDQSFSIALLDFQNNGFIISSLYSRDEMRVYAKPINEGVSEYLLSEEEKTAIEKAIKNK